jgi:hypothetical protein
MKDRRGAHATFAPTSPVIATHYSSALDEADDGNGVRLAAYQF